MFLEGWQVSSTDFDQLDTLFRGIVKEKQSFVRLEMSKEELLEMFKVCWCVGEGLGARASDTGSVGDMN